MGPAKNMSKKPFLKKNKWITNVFRIAGVQNKPRAPMYIKNRNIVWTFPTLLRFMHYAAGKSGFNILSESIYIKFPYISGRLSLKSPQERRSSISWSRSKVAAIKPSSCLPMDTCTSPQPSVIKDDP